MDTEHPSLRKSHRYGAGFIQVDLKPGFNFFGEA
jgi:hypothetical protein